MRYGRRVGSAAPLTGDLSGGVGSRNERRASIAWCCALVRVAPDRRTRATTELSSAWRGSSGRGWWRGARGHNYSLD